jgi:hypothetical protein
LKNFKVVTAFFAFIFRCWHNGNYYNENILKSKAISPLFKALVVIVRFVPS